MQNFGDNSRTPHARVSAILVGLLLFAQISHGFVATPLPERQAATDSELTSDADLQKIASVKRFWEVVQSIDWAKAKEPAMRSKIVEAMEPFGWRFDSLTLQNSADSTVRKRMDAKLSVDSPKQCLNAAAIAQALGLPNSVMPPVPPPFRETSQSTIEKHVRENSKDGRVFAMTYSIADQPRYELHFLGPFDCLGSFSVREPRSEAALKALKPQPKKWPDLYPEPTADADPKKVEAAKRLREVVQSIDWATVKQPAMRSKIRKAMEPFGWRFKYLVLPDPAVTTIEKRMVSSLSEPAYKRCPNAAAVAAGMGLPKSVMWPEPALYFETSPPKIEKFIRENYKTPGVLVMTYSIADQPQYELYVMGQLDCFTYYTISYKTKEE